MHFNKRARVYYKTCALLLGEMTGHRPRTCFPVLGGNVQGSKVLGQWPGLAPEQLYKYRDLAVTTDFGNVYSRSVPNRRAGEQRFRSVLLQYGDGIYGSIFSAV